MAFRANEEIERGRQMAMGKLLGRSLDPGQQQKSRGVLSELIDRYGPVIDCYPYWHPLVADNDDRQSPPTVPGARCGYEALDHAVFLRSGFIACPYDGGEAVLRSAERIDARDLTRGIASIEAEKIDAQLYHPSATPILVRCTWHRPLNRDGSIPTALAIPLLLERELPAWRSAQRAETWKTMAPYILGQPCGSRSSLFINEETGQALKTVWNTLINTGMFGPIRVDSW